LDADTQYIEFVEKIKNLLPSVYPDSPPLAHIHSFGCQQNESDSEKIKGLLADMGYGFTDDTNNAELIIYNTCAVRENAELKVFGNIGELKHLKELNPKLVIGICGCMAQQEHIVEKIRKTYKQVDMVWGTFALFSMPKLLHEVLTERKRVFEISESDKTIHENISTVRNGAFKASVPIMYGCNNFCSYCIVPYVRGRERSRSSEAIIDEIKGLVKDGYREIMLLGQNVNSYGKDLDEHINFSGLLKKIDNIDGNFRVRFMSSHPKDATFELVDTIIESKKICKHFHLPIQSGSDRILSQMNRNYTSEDYLKIIEHARNKLPDFSFSTDIIVGFPNENEEDFQKTMDIIRKVKYDNIYSFIYSKRTGTKAALIEDKTPQEEKTKHMRTLLSVQREIATERYKRFIGRTLRVLVDGEGKKGAGHLSGKSDEFIIVEFNGEKKLIGKFVEVEITAAHNWALEGNIIN